MKLLKGFLILKGLFLVMISSGMAQETDLLKLIEEEKPQVEKVKNAFKSTRVINGHSIEMLAGGVLDFRILHRFGKVNQGAYEMFGLDQASMRMGLDYGITGWLTAGVGRSTTKKEIDGFIKAKIISQTSGAQNFPFSVVLVEGIILNSLKFADPERKNYFTSRLSYYHQAIIGSKLSERLSLQLSPTMVHRNLTENAAVKNDIYALGTGARFKFTKRLALMVDYYYVSKINNASADFISPLSIGFDIETGGHVFQLHFTNSLGMNERAFISDTSGKWDQGDIHFGFNISRVFTLKDKRKHAQP